MTNKHVVQIIKPTQQHWVGDGFPVRTLLSYDTHFAKLQSPFLLLDYAGPYTFTPTQARRGVGPHPHRGFETVTVVYAGEVEHRDSSGAGGIIGAGDVQWMTAAGGIVHEEFHSPRFAATGGEFEVVQLWVNLPAHLKMNPARYQSLEHQSIPSVEFPHHQGQLRVIAGQFNTAKGAADTHTPIQLWDITLNKGADITLELSENHSTLILVRKGLVNINHAQAVVKAGELGICSLSGSQLTVSSQDEAQLLLLSGEPIDEPIVGYGPFVMNTQAEIRQAIQDYQQGKMGAL